MMECNHLASVSDLKRCWWCWCSGFCARFGPVIPLMLSLLVIISRKKKKKKREQSETIKTHHSCCNWASLVSFKERHGFGCHIYIWNIAFLGGRNATVIALKSRTSFSIRIMHVYVIKYMHECIIAMRC